MPSSIARSVITLALARSPIVMGNVQKHQQLSAQSAVSLPQTICALTSKYLGPSGQLDRTRGVQRRLYEIGLQDNLCKWNCQKWFVGFARWYTHVSESPSMAVIQR